MTIPFPSLTDRSIDWTSTIKLNVMRAFSAGLIWGVVSLTVGNGPMFGALLMPVVFAVGYVGAIPLFYIGAKIMSAVAGDIGMLGVRLATIFFALGIAAGDPLVYFLFKKRPDLMPVQVFKPFNFTMTLFVVNP
jgi:hypothetical protein